MGCYLGYCWVIPTIKIDSKTWREAPLDYMDSVSPTARTQKVTSGGALTQTIQSVVQYN